MLGIEVDNTITCFIMSRLIHCENRLDYYKIKGTSFIFPRLNRFQRIMNANRRSRSERCINDREDASIEFNFLNGSTMHCNTFRGRHPCTMHVVGHADDFNITFKHKHAVDMFNQPNAELMFQTFESILVRCGHNIANTIYEFMGDNGQIIHLLAIKLQLEYNKQKASYGIDTINKYFDESFDHSDYWLAKHSLDQDY